MTAQMPEPITARPFRDEADFWRVRALLIETYPLTLPGFNWEVRRWDGQRYHREEAEQLRGWSERVRLWESEDGRLVAAVHPEGVGDAHLQLHPDYRHLEEEMLAWAEEHLAAPVEGGGGRQLEVSAFEYDSPRCRLLQRRGYDKTPYGGVFRRLRLGAAYPAPDGNRPFARPPLPAGYVLRTTRPGDEDDYQRIADVLNAGFGRTFHTAAEYRSFVTQAPSFRHDLNLVAEVADSSMNRPAAQTAVATRAVTIQGTPQASTTYARDETLYTTGTQWGPPSNWNPFMGSNYAMGTIGLCYETLFLYDPLADEYTPWLAESGQWIDDKSYELQVRPGLTWSDGQPLTAADIKFTFELGRGAALSFSTLWDWLAAIDQVDANTLRFRFDDALYQEWANYLYNTPIVPQHLWQGRDASEVAGGANEAPVGSGPYLAESHDESHMVWLRNDNWWAIEALGLKVAPKRIVDVTNGSNNVALGLLLQGGLDLSNNLLPGVTTLVQGGYGLQSYYPEAPYMLSANTVWLVTNVQQQPMADLAFRQALAYAIDAEDIVEKDYGGLVRAADPTGLLPIWDEYIDHALVDRLGFRYDPDRARQVLADAGYKDVDGDKYVERPDGSEMALRLSVPNGWTDWMEAATIIADRLQAVGIDVQPDFPGYDDYLDALLQGTFELSLSNQPQMSNTVWSYYHWIFYGKLDNIATSQGGNYGRYDNERAFALVTQLDKTPVDDVAAMQAITSQLQEIQLADVPVIPLWYNGMWAQYSNAVWTNWPSSAADANHYLPCTWRGYWNMSGILMLTSLEPASR